MEKGNIVQSSSDLPINFPYIGGDFAEITSTFCGDVLKTIRVAIDESQAFAI